MNSGYAENTIRAYQSSWSQFQKWCRDAGRVSLPADTRDCIDHMCWCLAEGFRLETIHHRMKAVNFYHRRAELPEPAVNPEARAFLRNAKRSLCERPQGMRALQPEQLRRISRKLLQLRSPMHVRDRAILLLCFACGWRRAELVSLDVQDVHWIREGIVLWLGKSKTDQEGRGRWVGVNHGVRMITCPIRALQQWLDVRGSRPGPLFVSCYGSGRLSSRRLRPSAVRTVVKRSLELVREDSEMYAAHSLRAGMITAAFEAGATETAIMQRTGHTCSETLRRYIRPVRALRTNPLKGVL